jgi:hypothetical protein
LLDPLREDFRPPLRDDLREPFLGTFAPFSRASLNPIAIACLRLVTRFRDRPLFNVPRFLRRIADSTFFEADLPYFAMLTSRGKRLQGVCWHMAQVQKNGRAEWTARPFQGAMNWIVRTTPRRRR